MQYKNNRQSIRKKYLKGLPLSKEEQALYEKDFSKADYEFYQSEDAHLLLPEDYSADATYQIIESRISKNKRRAFVKYTGSVAAVFLLLILSTVIYKYSNQVEMHYVATTWGEKKTVQLPDGSTVVLNSLSSVTYQGELNGKNREIQLAGEAYFDVTKDAKKPFIVKANELEVKVLGTQFNVEAYENQVDIKTTLFEGSVSVSLTDGEKEVLSPGEQFVYNKVNNSTQKSTPENIENERAWQDNRLIFDNLPLSDILKSLAREHNIEFISTNKVLNNLRMTADFSSTESLDTILQKLGESAEFSFNKDGNVYTLFTRP